MSTTVRHREGIKEHVRLLRVVGWDFKILRLQQASTRGINRKTTDGHSASSVDSHLRSESVSGQGRLAASEEMMWCKRNNGVVSEAPLPSSVAPYHHFSPSQVKHVRRGETASSVLFYLPIPPHRPPSLSDSRFLRLRMVIVLQQGCVTHVAPDASRRRCVIAPAFLQARGKMQPLLTYSQL